MEVKKKGKQKCVLTCGLPLAMYCPDGRRIPAPFVSSTDSFTASVNIHSSVRARIYKKHQVRFKKASLEPGKGRACARMYRIQHKNADLKYFALNSALHISAHCSNKM